MIGPTSETGKAMLQSLTQQINMGMPVDQAIQYVKSQAAVGVAPLVDLYALLNQFQRMKQPPVQPPTGGTIKDQLSMLEAMNSGLGSPMQAPPNQSQMMGQGLGGLDAGAMENPQFNAAQGGIIPYAGGGMVAFSEGSVEPVRAANVKRELPKTYEDIQRLASENSEETMSGLEKQIQMQDAIDKRLGLGEYGQARKLRESQVTRIESDVAADEAKQAALDRQAYYADMGQIASEQGTRDRKAPTFLDVLARSQKGASERAQKRFESQKAAVKAAEDARIALIDADEARKAGNLTLYRAKVAEAKKLQDQATEKIAAGAQKRSEDEFSRNTQLQVAKAQRDTETERMLRELRLAKTPEEREDIANRIEIAKGRDAQGTSDRALYGRLVQEAYKKLLEAQQNDDPKAAESAQAELNRILKAGPKNLDKLGIVPPNVANPNAPPTTSNW